MTRTLSGLLLWLLVLAPSAVLANGDDNEALARRYMQAFDKLDIDALRPLLATDAHYSDRTATAQYNGPIERDGRDTVLASFDKLRSEAGVRELGLQWQQVFQSGDQVVFVGQVNVLAPGQDGKWLRWRTGMVTALTLRERMVVRHQDFADYPGAVTKPSPPPPGRQDSR